VRDVTGRNCFKDRPIIAFLVHGLYFSGLRALSIGISCFQPLRVYQAHSFQIQRSSLFPSPNDVRPSFVKIVYGLYDSQMCILIPSRMLEIAFSIDARIRLAPDCFPTRGPVACAIAQLSRFI
jgi:hypothetical protein